MYKNFRITCWRGGGETQHTSTTHKSCFCFTFPNQTVQAKFVVPAVHHQPGCRNGSDIAVVKIKSFGVDDGTIFLHFFLFWKSIVLMDGPSGKFMLISSILCRRPTFDMLVAQPYLIQKKEERSKKKEARSKKKD